MLLRVSVKMKQKTRGDNKPSKMTAIAFIGKVVCFWEDGR